METNERGNAWRVTQRAIGDAVHENSGEGAGCDGQENRRKPGQFERDGTEEDKIGPSMKMSPWAKLMSRRIPYTMVYPMAMRE